MILFGKKITMTVTITTPQAHKEIEVGKIKNGYLYKGEYFKNLNALLNYIEIEIKDFFKEK